MDHGASSSKTHHQISIAVVAVVALGRNKANMLDQTNGLLHTQSSTLTCQTPAVAITPAANDYPHRVCGSSRQLGPVRIRTASSVLRHSRHHAGPNHTTATQQLRSCPAGPCINCLHVLFRRIHRVSIILTSHNWVGNA